VLRKIRPSTFLYTHPGNGLSIVKPDVFVAIAADADPELPLTLRDASEQARFSDRLRFGICWQADPKGPISPAEFRRSPRPSPVEGQRAKRLRTLARKGPRARRERLDSRGRRTRPTAITA